MIWFVKGVSTPTKIVDADGDTKVDVEESADEDIVRMDVAGVEAFKLNSDGILDLAKQSRARAYKKAADQTISTATPTKVVLDEETYDEQNEFDSVTNYRFTATKAGYYLVTAAVVWGGLIDQARGILQIYKNGAEHSAVWTRASGAATFSTNISDIIYLAAADFLELNVYHNKGSNTTIKKGSNLTYMAVHKLS